MDNTDFDWCDIEESYNYNDVDGMIANSCIEHDLDLLDKVMQKQRIIIDEDGVMYKVVFLKDIEDLKAGVSK